MKIAVILSGCGYLDGAEIRESVLSLLYLDEMGAEVSCFAPDLTQMHVVNHLSGEASATESRNVRVEAARIARGKVDDLANLNPNHYDALVIPGGFGVAKNLSDFALKEKDCEVNADFKRVVHGFIDSGKPIGAICIAPAILVAALSGNSRQPTVTIGEDTDTAAAIAALGGIHQNCETHDFVYDAANNIASCSAYMREDNIAEIAKGIRKVIEKIVEKVS